MLMKKEAPLRQLNDSRETNIEAVILNETQIQRPKGRNIARNTLHVKHRYESVIETTSMSIHLITVISLSYESIFFRFRLKRASCGDGSFGILTLYML